MSTGRLSLDSGTGFVVRTLPQAAQAASSAPVPAELARRIELDGVSVPRGQSSELKLDGEQHAGNARSGSRASRG